MKKSSIWKLLFSALTVFAVAVFAGCTDDNDDMGAPYLNVTPENLTFDAEGQPADEYNGTFIVETNRPWRAIVEDEQTWVRLSATEGEGDAAVTVTVPASNIGQSAKVTFEVYNSYGALIQKDVNVLQGEVVPPTIIFNETAGNEAVDDKPLVSAYTGWNTTGEGASKVSYEGTNTSIRSSGKSSAGAYDGASGPNVIFFGTAPATFTVKNITLASGQTNLKLTFGGQYYDQDNNDNGFKKDDFVVSLSANGTDYTPLSYEVNNGDQEDPYWVFATKNFTLKNATSTLYIKFEANISSKFRLDDITLMTGNGGEEIDLAGGGVVPPDPSGDAIYENNFDKTPAEKVDNKWPFLDQTDAWQNASGTGNSTVTYTFTNVSVRTSGKLSGGYDGASGSNKIFFGSAPATFDINNITMPAGKTNYRIIFGGAYSQSNGGTYDNIFKPESFHVAVGNGTDWSGNLTYEKIGGSDTTDPYWVQFAVDFTLKEAVSQLSIRFTADLASVFAIDDVQLVEGNGGQEVDLEGGVVPPDPGDATIITVDFGESAQGLPTSKADGAGPSEKTYTFSGYEFIINVAAGANVYWLDGSKWNTTPPNKAMYFNGDDTYIQFPVVAGKKLTKVEFSSPYGAGAGVGIVIKDTSDAIVAGGEMQTINANETITFNLTGTTADTAYRMARTAKNAQCTKLVLSYE
ncbi:BACON domain-containing protein [Alistipes putredinis]|uniref:BACON domain-containing protein n=1 Tax=Alistipes putredinis TaxID=28117 RepID=UPI003AB4F633